MERQEQLVLQRNLCGSSNDLCPNRFHDAEVRVLAATGSAHNELASSNLRRPQHPTGIKASQQIRVAQ